LSLATELLSEAAEAAAELLAVVAVAVAVPFLAVAFAFASSNFVSVLLSLDSSLEQATDESVMALIACRTPAFNSVMALLISGIVVGTDILFEI
jgi:hypothetical protein